MSIKLFFSVKSVKLFTTTSHSGQEIRSTLTTVNHVNVTITQIVVDTMHH